MTCGAARTPATPSPHSIRPRRLRALPRLPQASRRQLGDHQETAARHVLRERNMVLLRPNSFVDQSRRAQVTSRGHGIRTRSDSWLSLSLSIARYRTPGLAYAVKSCDACTEAVPGVAEGPAFLGSRLGHVRGWKSRNASRLCTTSFVVSPPISLSTRNTICF